MEKYLICLTFVFASLPAFAQDAQVEAPEVVRPFTPGTFDILVGGGFGGFLYPHVEPSLDIGLIPIADDFTVSIGGGADFGICLLCAALTAATNYNVASRYFTPFGRLGFHFGSLGGLLKSDKPFIDLYAGLFGGPTFYTFSVNFDGTSERASAKTTSFLLGPILGARLSWGDNRFLLFGEYRLGLEFGFSNATVTDGNGNDITVDNGFRRGGSDFIGGVGIRF